MIDISDEDISALCTELEHIPVSVISDVLAEAGLTGQIVSAWLRSMVPFRRFAGPARCFSGRPGVDPAADSELVYEADRTIRRGDVIVLDTGCFHAAAVTGGNTVAGWRIRGCAGVVLDGMLRDLDDIGGTPCLSRGTTPLNSKGRWHYTSLVLPCKLPGQEGGKVDVFPGDIVHADIDGIAIIPRRHARKILEYAQQAQSVETMMRTAIETGRDRGDVYKSHSRFGHIRKLC